MDLLIILLPVLFVLALGMLNAMSIQAYQNAYLFQKMKIRRDLFSDEEWKLVENKMKIKFIWQLKG